MNPFKKKSGTQTGRLKMDTPCVTEVEATPRPTLTVTTEVKAEITGKFFTVRPALDAGTYWIHGRGYMDTMTVSGPESIDELIAILQEIKKVQIIKPNVVKREL